MAFFDFDRRIQTFLIAGALASMTACGGDVGLDGATDTSGGDAVDVEDTGDAPFIDVDPLPDVLDPDITDPPDGDVPLACPDPSTWEVAVAEDSSAWPTMTLRVTVNVPDPFIDTSDPVFSVERKRIDTITRISDSEYLVVYAWEGTVEPWGDWDRLHVSWTVSCVDADGRHERVLSAEQLICVMDGSMWLGWGTDPSDCMMVDPPPYKLDDWKGPAVREEDGSNAPPTLPRGVLKTRLESRYEAGGAVRLLVRPVGPAAAAATFAWTASSGRIEAKGPVALWHPPDAPGVHVVQVLTRAGPALCVDVFRTRTGQAAGASSSSVAGA